MGVIGYRLLGFALWRALRWYLRRRLPGRRLAGVTALALVGALGAGLAARREGT
jgi:hypothetical protein